MLPSRLKVLSSLSAGSIGYKTFKTLRLTTGLSATWLSKILREMMKEGLVTQEGIFYSLTEEGKERFRNIGNYAYPLFLLEKLSLFSEKVAKNPNVEGVILFGSLPQGRANARSDADLFIIVKDGQYTSQLEEEIRRRAHDFELLGEFFIVKKSSFIDHLANITLLLGILEGYKILFDREGRFSHAIERMKTKLLKGYEYVREARVWVKK